MTAASLTGTGTVQLDNGSKFEVQQAVGGGQDIVFDGAGGTLLLDSPALFDGTITGFAAGDKIDLSAIPTGSSAAAFTFTTARSVSLSTPTTLPFRTRRSCSVTLMSFAPSTT